MLPTNCGTAYKSVHSYAKSCIEVQIFLFSTEEKQQKGSKLASVFDECAVH